MNKQSALDEGGSTSSIDYRKKKLSRVSFHGPRLDQIVHGQVIYARDRIEGEIMTRRF